jgi:hypothetical protein
MSKLMKKYLLAFLLALATVEAAHASATKFTDLAVTNNLTVTGAITAGSVNCSNVSTTTLTAANLVATYGLNASTGVFHSTGGAVQVSSATASNDSLYIAGAFAALPATGYNRGALAILTSTMALYISTETVAGTFSWIKVGSQ